MDHRDPSAREETFLASWEFHLRYRTHPGCVYHLLPGLAEHYGLDEDGRAWLAWLNGNTQNPVTSMLLLEASGGSIAGRSEEHTSELQSLMRISYAAICLKKKST